MRFVTCDPGTKFRFSKKLNEDAFEVPANRGHYVNGLIDEGYNEGVPVEAPIGIATSFNTKELVSADFSGKRIDEVQNIIERCALENF